MVVGWVPWIETSKNSSRQTSDDDGCGKEIRVPTHSEYKIFSSKIEDLEAPSCKAELFLGRRRGAETSFVRIFQIVPF